MPSPSCSSYARRSECECSSDRRFVSLGERTRAAGINFRGNIRTSTGSQRRSILSTGDRYASPVNCIPLGADLLVPHSPEMPGADISGIEAVLEGAGFDLYWVNLPTTALGGSVDRGGSLSGDLQETPRGCRPSTLVVEPFAQARNLLRRERFGVEASGEVGARFHAGL